MSKKRVLHVTSSLKLGGAEQLLYTLVRGLAREYEQSVCYIHPGPFVQQLEQLGVHTIPLAGSARLGIFDPRICWRLYRVIQQYKPVVIHSMLWAGNQYARIVGSCIAGVPVVSAYHNDATVDGRVRSVLDQLTTGYAARTVAVSHQVKQSLSERVQVQKVHAKRQPQVIVNGIDPQMFAMDRYITRTELGIPADVTVFLAVGRFVPVKQFGRLIDAYHAVRSDTTLLLIVGYGPLEGALRKQVERLGLSGHVRFSIGQPAVHYMQVADLFVQPSRSEGVSIALLEALYHRLPAIVMTNVGGVHPVIQHKRQGLIAYSQKSLVQGMHMMHQQREQRMQWGVAARVLVEKKFNAIRMCQKYAQVFDSCIADQGMIWGRYKGEV